MLLPHFLSREKEGKAPIKTVSNDFVFCSNCHKRAVVPEVLVGKEIRTTNETIALGCHHCKGKVVFKLLNK